MNGLWRRNVVAKTVAAVVDKETTSKADTTKGTTEQPVHHISVDRNLNNSDVELSSPREVQPPPL